MEATKPIEVIKPGNENMQKINFIEQLIISCNNKEYKIHFGMNESSNKKEIIIKVALNNANDLFFFQNKFDINEFQNFSKIFCMYENSKEIISFLKSLKYEIIDKKDSLILKFNVFLPNGDCKSIELNLKKKLLDQNIIIEYLLKENKVLKDEISILKNNISNNYNENISLREENKKLWDEINKIKEQIKKINVDLPIEITFDSKIINSLGEIDFILDYIKQNDKEFSFEKIVLLFRGSRDGDDTQICHKLCDRKKNVLIIIKTDTGYIFGGYSKIGFEANNYQDEYKIDNNCFLFSKNLKKIYPVIQNKKVICNVNSSAGLCFYGSLTFRNKFMNNYVSNICGGDFYNYFSGLQPDSKKINGGKVNYKCQELKFFNYYKNIKLKQNFENNRGFLLIRISKKVLGSN